MDCAPYTVAQVQALAQCGVERITRTRLYGKMGLVNLISLIPSLASAHRRSLVKARCGEKLHAGLSGDGGPAPTRAPSSDPTVLCSRSEGRTWRAEGNRYLDDEPRRRQEGLRSEDPEGAGGTGLGRGRERQASAAAEDTSHRRRRCFWRRSAPGEPGKSIPQGCGTNKGAAGVMV